MESEGASKVLKRKANAINRIEWLDYSRGLAIILVVLAHSQCPTAVFEFLTYIIAIFPFISGYLYPKDGVSVKKIIKKRSNLILSYYFLGFINYLFWVFAAQESFKNVGTGECLKNFILVRTDLFNAVPINIIPLWYLFFLFVVELLYTVLRNRRLLAVGIAFGIFLRVYSSIHHVAMPFKIDVAFTSLITLEFGRLFKERVHSKLRLWQAITALGIWLSIAWINGGSNWNTGDYGKFGILSLVGEFAAIIFIVWVAQVVEKNNPKIVWSQIASVVSRFSEDSIFVLGYHITVGGIIIGILSMVGMVVTEETLRAYWYITFPSMLVPMYLLILLLPKPLKLALSQPYQFYQLVSSKRRQN